ncbi:MAG TPA: hypothetical protein PK720_02155 [bacterium]|nr:hypothetical protein [bacterium]
MKKLFFFMSLFIFASSVWITGCTAIKEDVLGEDPDLKVDYKTVDPVNREDGVTLEELDDIDASKSSRKDMKRLDSLQSLSPKTISPGAAIEESEETIEVKEVLNYENSDIGIIDSRGFMRGHIVNLSNRRMQIKIFRIRSDGTEKLVFNKSFTGMVYEPYYLAKGTYVGYRTIGSKEDKHDFVVRKDQPADFQLDIYYPKKRITETIDLKGFWYLANEEYTKIVAKQ